MASVANCIIPIMTCLLCCELAVRTIMANFNVLIEQDLQEGAPYQTVGPLSHRVWLDAPMDPSKSATCLSPAALPPAHASASRYAPPARCTSALARPPPESPHYATP